MIKLKPISTLILLTFLAGCGNSEMRAIKRDFMSGCQQGASKKVCSCAFDEWSSGYAESNFIQLSKGQGMVILDRRSESEQLAAFMEKGMKAIHQCMKK